MTLDECSLVEGVSASEGAGGLSIFLYFFVLSFASIFPFVLTPVLFATAQD